MLIVKNKKRIEYTLKEYRKKVKETKLIEKIRDKRYYEKPSSKRRNVKNKAKRRNEWK
jgi:ribosomal protein S21